MTWYVVIHLHFLRGWGDIPYNRPIRLVQESERAIPYQEGHKWAQEQDCPFFEASAVNAEGVEDAFKALLRKVLAVQNSANASEPEGVNLGGQQPSSKPASGCRC